MRSRTIDLDIPCREAVRGTSLRDRRCAAERCSFREHEKPSHRSRPNLARGRSPGRGGPSGPTWPASRPHRARPTSPQRRSVRVAGWYARMSIEPRSPKWLKDTSVAPPSPRREGGRPVRLTRAACRRSRSRSSPSPWKRISNRQVGAKGSDDAYQLVERDLAGASSLDHGDCPPRHARFRGEASLRPRRWLRSRRTSLPSRTGSIQPSLVSAALRRRSADLSGAHPRNRSHPGRPPSRRSRSTYAARSSRPAYRWRRTLMPMIAIRPYGLS